MPENQSADAIHQAARRAKEFLIAKVIEEAGRENVPLSDVERKMLYFSETDESLPDIYDVNAQFDRKYVQREYEAKIAGLIRKAYKSDSEGSADGARRWEDAIRALRKEDHYILVMVDQAHLRPPGDLLRLIASATAVVAVLVVFVFLTVHGSIPDWWIRNPWWLFGFVAVWALASLARRGQLGQVLRAILGGVADSLGLRRPDKR